MCPCMDLYEKGICVCGLYVNKNDDLTKEIEETLDIYGAEKERAFQMAKEKGIAMSEAIAELFPESFLNEYLGLYDDGDELFVVKIKAATKQEAKGKFISYLNAK